MFYSEQPNFPIQDFKAKEMRDARKKRNHSIDDDPNQLVSGEGQNKIVKVASSCQTINLSSKKQIA